MRGAAAKWVVRVLYAAVLFGAASCAQGAETIHAVRLESDAEHTRAIFEISAPLDYKIFEIGNPDRVVLDVHDANFGQNFAAPAGAGLLKSLRTGRLGKDGV